MNVVRPWKLAGRTRYGHRLESEGVAVAIQSPLSHKGWELYGLDGFGRELFAGYAQRAQREMLDNTLAALLDVRTGAA